MMTEVVVRHLWKFQNRPQLTRLLAELFLDALATHSTRAPEASAGQPPDDEPWLFVPIPTQWQRHIRRGFDHTWLLAQALGAIGKARVLMVLPAVGLDLPDAL